MRAKLNLAAKSSVSSFANADLTLSSLIGQTRSFILEFKRGMGSKKTLPTMKRDISKKQHDVLFKSLEIVAKRNHCK